MGLMPVLAPIGGLELLLADSTYSKRADWPILKVFFFSAKFESGAFHLTVQVKKEKQQEICMKRNAI